MIDQNWGRTLTLGVEEELMLVDAETLSQRPVSAEVIPRVAAERGVVKHELFASIVELNSGETATPDKANAEVYRELQELQDDTSLALRNVFEKHRRFVTKR